MIDHFAFYGTLMESADAALSPSHAGLLAFVGPCLVPGVLRDHGPYPGLFHPADGVDESVGSEPAVKAELFKILSPEAFGVLDRYEAYDADDEENSLYLRRSVKLLEPQIDAWIYISQGASDDPVITHGDWIRHLDAGS